MKKFIAANLIILIALTVKATQDYKNREVSEFEKKVNAHAHAAIKFANLQNQVDFQKRAADNYKAKYKRAMREKEVILTEFKTYQLKSEKLVEVLDKKGLLTPEIAKYTKRYEGRLPASKDSSKKK